MSRKIMQNENSKIWKDLNDKITRKHEMPDTFFKLQYTYHLELHQNNQRIIIYRPSIYSYFCLVKTLGNNRVLFHTDGDIIHI